MNPNASMQDIGNSIKNWFEKMPSFCRLLLYSTLCLYLISWISLGLVLLLANIPVLVVGYFQIWRLFTAPLVPLGFLHVLFEMISFLPTAVKIERRMSTSGYFVFFALNSLTVQTVFALAMYGASFIPGEFFASLALRPSAGLWPIIMIEMVIRCNKNPDSPTQFFLCPFTMKAKYFPWFFFLLFSLFMGVVWELLVGIGVGYLHVYELLPFFTISNSKAEYLESSVLACLKCIPVFIDVANSGEEELPMTSQPQSTPSYSYNAGQPPAQAPTQAFSGKGHRLGGGPERYNRLQEPSDLQEAEEL